MTLFFVALKAVCCNGSSSDTSHKNILPHFSRLSSLAERKKSRGFSPNSVELGKRKQLRRFFFCLLFFLPLTKQGPYIYEDNVVTKLLLYFFYYTRVLL